MTVFYRNVKYNVNVYISKLFLIVDLTLFSQVLVFKDGRFQENFSSVDGSGSSSGGGILSKIQNLRLLSKVENPMRSVLLNHSVSTPGVSRILMWSRHA